jgi:YHS domain-containing protein
MTTKALATVLCAFVLAAMVAVAQDKKPINAKCPVKTGEAAKADITSDYEGKTVGFCCGNCKGAFDKEPAKFAAKIPELKAPPAKGEAKAAGPVNTNCPVDSNGVNSKYVVSVQGKVIAFCNRSCYNKFIANMALYLPNVPGFETKKAEDKKPDDKKGDKPVTYGPCDCKRVVKGYYCLDCKRELGADDVRNNVCKRCENKPAPIEYCLKVSPPYLHPGEKTARSDEDKARITYECEVCGVKGEVEAEFKHKPDCKPSFGDGIKKVCTKSGTAPHRSEK